MSRRRSLIEGFILRQLREKGTVTFKELYALGKFSEQGIRNRMYKLIEKGFVKKIKKEKERVKFKLKTNS